jgi:hypothetical protein
MISVNSAIVASTEQVSCEVAGEIVILSLSDAVYYGLDEVGARIWSLIQERRTVREICDVITSEYDVDPETCETTTIQLLSDLHTKGLVEVRDAAA